MNVGVKKICAKITRKKKKTKFTIDNSKTLL